MPKHSADNHAARPWARRVAFPSRHSHKHWSISVKPYMCMQLLSADMAAYLYLKPKYTCKCKYLSFVPRSKLLNDMSSTLCAKSEHKLNGIACRENAVTTKSSLQRWTRHASKLSWLSQRCPSFLTRRAHGRAAPASNNTLILGLASLVIHECEHKRTYAYMYVCLYLHVLRHENATLPEILWLICEL